LERISTKNTKWLSKIAELMLISKPLKRFQKAPIEKIKNLINFAHIDFSANFLSQKARTKQHKEKNLS
jgi:hypothetical protein